MEFYDIISRDYCHGERRRGTIRIIISPAMKMKIDNDIFFHRNMPTLLNESREILDYLKRLSYDELKSIWKTSDKIAGESFQLIQNMDLERSLSPAIFSFEGIQYQYMGPGTFTHEELDYIEEHLRILSGFYGILRPFDGVRPYRLEMQSKFMNWIYPSLYDFWKDRLTKELIQDARTVLNLASKEYSRAIRKHLPKDMEVIECIFGEEINGRVIEKGTLAKMARGEMVRYMAKNKIKDLEKIKGYKGLNYLFKEELSDNNKYVFIRKTK